MSTDKNSGIQMTPQGQLHTDVKDAIPSYHSGTGPSSLLTTHDVPSSSNSGKVVPTSSISGNVAPRE